MFLPIPAQSEGIGYHVGTFVFLEQRYGRVAQIETYITIAGLYKQVDTDRIHVHVSADTLFLTAIDMGKRFYAMADFNFRTETEKERTSVKAFPAENSGICSGKRTNPI